MARKFTNIPSVAADDEEYTFVDEKGAKGTPYTPGDTVPPPPQEEPSPFVETAPGTDKDTEAKLGVGLQGSFDKEKVQRLFPGMFAQPEQWLDPAEQAKKEAGMKYDAGKRFKPSTPEPVQEPKDRYKRDEFESIVFQQIGGNPFMFDPYQEVIRADRALPQIFNQAFQGQVIWEDRGKLDKDQAKHWADVKKQYHAHVYNAAKSKKKQMVDTYQWMMSKFDSQAKEEQAAFALEEKRRAAYLAEQGKGPKTMGLYNEFGIKTLHEYKDGDWVDTGRRMEKERLEPQENVPPNVRFAQQQIAKFNPRVDSNMLMMATMTGNKDLVKMLLEASKPQIPEDQKANYETWKKIVDAWTQKEHDRLFGKSSAAGGPAAAPAPVPGQETTSPASSPASSPAAPSKGSRYKFDRESDRIPTK